MKKIIVTGANGFIGSNLVSHLLDQDYQVTALCRGDSGHIDLRAEIARVDILDIYQVKNAFVDQDCVFHCAGFVGFSARDYEKAWQINVQGTKNVLQAALDAKVKKVVHLSACAVLGVSKSKNIILDETTLPEIKKSDVYAYTKMLAESEVAEFVKQGLDVSIANISTTYGAGDWNLNSGSIIKSIFSGGMRVLPPGGTSYVSVSDLVRGLELIALKGRAGERYILSTENLSFKELVQRIAKQITVETQYFASQSNAQSIDAMETQSIASLQRFVLPSLALPPLIPLIGLKEQFAKSSAKVNLMTVKILKDSFGFKYFSSEKAKKELGWHPSEKLEDAVSQALKFYKKNNLL